MFVLLDAIDVATASWVERKIFEIGKPEALRVALGVDEIELNRVYELVPSDLSFIEHTYGAAFADRSLPVQMVVVSDRKRYDELASHTGRELLLMLAGKKPFAHFYRFDRPEEDGIVPEEQFEPHVREGRIVRVDEIVETTRFGAARKIYYALRGEEWRIEAFKTLLRLSEKYNRWDDTLEKMEGYLLGYEIDIDPFHR